MDINKTSNISAIFSSTGGISPPTPVSDEAKHAASDGLKVDGQAHPLESTASPNAPPSESKPNGEELKSISDKLQQIYKSDLIFKVDEKSGEYVIQVIDRKTKDVIQQIPSKEALKLREIIDQFQKGLLVNTKI